MNKEDCMGFRVIPEEFVVMKAKILCLQKALLLLTEMHHDWPMTVSDEDEELIMRLKSDAESSLI
jgi:hypothetical protein